MSNLVLEFYVGYGSEFKAYRFQGESDEAVWAVYNEINRHLDVAIVDQDGKQVAPQAPK
jgi:hypothetical protein